MGIARVGEENALRARRAALCAMLLIGLAAPARAEDCRPLDLAAVRPALEQPVATATLANGLRVFVLPRPASPTVAVHVAYDVGARDEPAGRSGLAHLFEHMMFKGSENVPDGGHFRAVRDVGGNVNAATDYDHTIYWNRVPAAHLERVLFLEADRMRGLRVDDARLENQRRAIAEERALRIDNVPYVAAAAAFLEWVWRGTPYGHSPVGSDAELAAVDLATAARFHRDYYAPGNAVVTIAGGVAPDAALAMAETHFGAIPPGPARPERDGFELAREPGRREATDPLAPFPVYAFVWHGAGLTGGDALALAVLDDLLLGHDGARFARHIRGELAFEAYSLSFAFRDVGLLNFVFAPRTYASFDDVSEAVAREVVSLREEGPTEREVCRSVKREQLALLAAIETDEGLAGTATRGVLVTGDPLQVARDVRALGRLDRGTLRDAARRHLGGAPFTLEIEPAGSMRWVKAWLEWLPRGVGESLEDSLL